MASTQTKQIARRIVARETDRTSFRDKLVRIIQEKKINLQELSRQLEIPYGSIRGYVKPGSNRLPSAPTGIALARALQVSIEWLFDESRAWPPVPYCADQVMNFYARFRPMAVVELLTREKLTPAQFAERVGTSRQNIGNWMAGTTAPQFNTILRMCAAFSVGLMFFVESNSQDADSSDGTEAGNG